MWVLIGTVAYCLCGLVTVKVALRIRADYWRNEDSELLAVVFLFWWFPAFAFTVGKAMAWALRTIGEGLR